MLSGGPIRDDAGSVLGIARYVSVYPSIVRGSGAAAGSTGLITCRLVSREAAYSHAAWVELKLLMRPPAATGIPATGSEELTSIALSVPA